MHGTRGYSLKLQSVLAKLELTHKEQEETVSTLYSCSYAKSDIKAARSILDNLLSSIPICNEISSITEIPKEVEEL